jgi:ABC-type multidrug transport system ATPase subunit
MIELTDLVARTPSGPKLDIGPMSLALPSGTSTTFVGTPDDGVELVLAVIAGSVKPRRGKVLVAGKPASARRDVAYVPSAPDLPAVLTVDAYLGLAARVRGEPSVPSTERLAVLGVASLARRRVGGLSLEEARAVALTEALTSRAAVLLLADPLADLDPRAVPRFADALAARVRDGATAVSSTASKADARTFGASVHSLERGKLVSPSPNGDGWAPAKGPRGARLFVRSEGARLLLASLAEDPTFQEVRADGAELVVTGQDAVAMASAVWTASRHANVEIDVLSFTSPEGDA